MWLALLFIIILLPFAQKEAFTNPLYDNDGSEPCIKEPVYTRYTQWDSNLGYNKAEIMKYTDNKRFTSVQNNDSLIFTKCLF